MFGIGEYVETRGEDVTWMKRTLNTTSRDTVTGWPPVSWSTETIKVVVEALNVRIIDSDGGRVDEVRLQAYTTAKVLYLDRLVVRGDTYVVDIEPGVFNYEGSEVYRTLNLLKVS